MNHLQQTLYVTTQRCSLYANRFIASTLTFGFLGAVSMLVVRRGRL